MNEKHLRSVVGNLRRAISPNPACRITDAMLLDRFLSRRDELAFEMLVWRHGSMVLNVCRRVLRDPHAAEDAFQATFLVFVRKLGSIGKRQAVGSWLYKVAYRVALRARERTALRRTVPLTDYDRMPATPAGDDPAQRALWNDLRPVLDEEVNRLPEKYRTPFVLFYLEGMAYPELAAELGCPKGTVSSRLTTAKGLLRKRLARRGVVLSAALLGAVLARSATAAVTIGLATSTMQTIRLIAGGPAAGAGTVSAPAVALAEGVLKAMLMTKVKLVTAVLLAAGVLGFGTNFVIQRAAQGAQPAPAERPSLKPPLEVVDTPPAAAPAAPEKPGKLTLDRPPVADVPTTPPAPKPVGVTVAPLTPAGTPAAPTPAPVSVTPTGFPPVHDASLADRLAKVEDRLARIEAQLKIQPKAAGPKAEAHDPFAPAAPETTPPPKPANHSYGKPRPGLFDPTEVPPAENIATVTTKRFVVRTNVDSNLQPTIAQLHLYVSSDSGKTWKIMDAIQGKLDSFPVSVPGDGVYWFKVHEVYKLGPTSEPAYHEKTVPDLKVRVVSTAGGGGREATLAELEAQLKAIQQRIADLKAPGGETPGKPGRKIDY